MQRARTAALQLTVSSTGLLVVEALTLDSPCSTIGVATIQESMTLVAECINRAHKATELAAIVPENMVHCALALHDLSTSTDSNVGWFREYCSVLSLGAQQYRPAGIPQDSGPCTL